MRFLTHCYTLLLLTFSLTAVHAASEVIELNYRMAQDVLSVAQSVLGDEGRASAYGNQLIVNATSDKIAELRSVLSTLDTQPRRLLITVDTQSTEHNRQRGYQVDGIISGRQGELMIGQGEQNDRQRVRIMRNTTQNRGGALRSIQTLEGSAALIQVGQDIAQHSTHSGPYGHTQGRTEYRSVNQGFYVTATVHGDRVHIEIDSRNDRLNTHRTGVINTHRVSSRVSGRLGEWINVSVSQEANNAHEKNLTHKHYSTGRQDSQLQLKVQVLD